MSATGGRARTGEIKRTVGGWAIRYRDARGVRRQRGGFRTKGEAKAVLDDELRKARLGPLYRPNATLQEWSARSSRSTRARHRPRIGWALPCEGDG